MSAWAAGEKTRVFIGLKAQVVYIAAENTAAARRIAGMIRDAASALSEIPAGLVASRTPTKSL